MRIKQKKRGVGGYEYSIHKAHHHANHLFLSFPRSIQVGAQREHWDVVHVNVFGTGKRVGSLMTMIKLKMKFCKMMMMMMMMEFMLTRGESVSINKLANLVKQAWFPSKTVKARMTKP